MKSRLFLTAIGLSAVALIHTGLADETSVSARPAETNRQILKSTSDGRLTESKNDGAVDARKDADNTDRNKRDRDGETLTPGDQGNTKEDIEVTRQIRRALVKDQALSTTAKNVKIMTRDGKVTLRGPVKTIGEKEAIVAKAKNAATSHPVIDELEVKSGRDGDGKIKSVEAEVNAKP
jgi:hyperosmotically inducible periplasmic protein